MYNIRKYYGIVKLLRFNHIYFRLVKINGSCWVVLLTIFLWTNMYISPTNLEVWLAPLVWCPSWFTLLLRCLMEFWDSVIFPSWRGLWCPCASLSCFKWQDQSRISLVLYQVDFLRAPWDMCQLDWLRFTKTLVGWQTAIYLGIARPSS